MSKDELYDELYKVLGDACALLTEIGRCGLAQGGEQPLRRAECFEVARRATAAQTRLLAPRDVSGLHGGEPEPVSYDVGSPSNDPEVWRRLVGQRIVGAFTVKGCVWLVTPSRAAFVFNSSGTFWRAPAKEVATQVETIKADIDAKIAMLRDVLALADPSARASATEIDR